MTHRRETILVIEPDPGVRSTLAEGILEASGQYTTITAADGVEGMSMAVSHAPDLIIMEPDLPGMSGKDLMVALNSQGVDVPIIITTHQGGEALAVEAFRLGAKDYVTKPFREAEIISAIERALDEMRLRYERDQLTHNLQSVNLELEQRLEEERTLFAIGKYVTSMTNVEMVFNRIVEAATFLTGAEMSGVLLRDDRGDSLVLRAGENLPRHLADRMGQPVGDDLASLVMTSREPLLASGDGLKRFNPPHDAHSVIYVPLIVAEQPVGVLWVGNQSVDAEFVDRQKPLLSALADYAAISVVNARLFQVMEQRAHRLEQANEQFEDQQTSSSEQIAELTGTIRSPLEEIRHDLHLLRTNEHRLHPQNEASLDVLDRKIDEMLTYLDEVTQYAEQSQHQ